MKRWQWSKRKWVAKAMKDELGMELAWLFFWGFGVIVCLAYTSLY